MVGVVAAAGLDGVDAAGWDPFGETVGHVDGPAAFRVLAMVETAGEGEIFDVGSAAVGPRVDVVGFAPVGGPVAGWEGTAPVAGGEGEALGGAGGAAGAAEVQHGSAGVEDSGNDLGVGGELERGRDGEGAAVGGGGQPEAGFQLVEGEGEQHGGRGAAGVGQVAGP